MSQLVISKSNLINNFNYFKNLKTHVFPVLKANAYGHGLQEVLSILETLSFPCICLARGSEAIDLNYSGDILILSSWNEQHLLKENSHCIFSLQSKEDLKTLKSCFKSQLNKKIRVHICLNSGMNRLGFSADQFSDLEEFLNEHDESLSVEGIFSHLSQASDSHEYSLLQFQCFSRMLQAQIFQNMMSKNNLYIHFQNSYGSQLSFSSSELNSSRIGLGLYGVSESPHLKLAKELKAVMSLKCRLRNILKLKKDSYVGYGTHYQLKRDSLIGVLPLGYADGLRRDSSLQGKKTDFYVNDVALPVVGAVSMDLCHVDLSDLNFSFEELFEVDFSLINKNQGVEKIAQIHDTISYEILTGLSSRLTRTLVE